VSEIPGSRENSDEQTFRSPGTGFRDEIANSSASPRITRDWNAIERGNVQAIGNFPRISARTADSVFHFKSHGKAAARIVLNSIGIVRSSGLVSSKSLARSRLGNCLRPDVKRDHRRAIAAIPPDNYQGTESLNRALPARMRSSSRPTIHRARIKYSPFGE